jgi:hypothetical protein
VTPKKSNNKSSSSANAKNRFNPTFPFTSSKDAINTPDTVGMATPDTDTDASGDADEHVTCTCTIPAAR